MIPFENGVHKTGNSGYLWVVKRIMGDGQGRLVLITTICVFQ